VKLRGAALVCLAVMLGCVPAAAQGAAAISGPACRAGSTAMVRTELIFGTERAQLPAVTKAQWRRFVDREVARRFPGGFTLLDGSGEWRGSRGIVRENAHVLIVWHRMAAEQDASIEALRALYKARFRQDAVARMDSFGCAAF
jgi:hypothetical protein